MTNETVPTHAELDAATLAQNIKRECDIVLTHLHDMIDLALAAKDAFAADGTDSHAFHDYFHEIIRREMAVQVFTNRVTDLLAKHKG